MRKLVLQNEGLQAQIDKMGTMEEDVNQVTQVSEEARRKQRETQDALKATQLELLTMHQLQTEQMATLQADLEAQATGELRGAAMRWTKHNMVRALQGEVAMRLAVWRSMCRISAHAERRSLTQQQEHLRQEMESLDGAIRITAGEKDNEIERLTQEVERLEGEITEEQDEKARMMTLGEELDRVLGEQQQEVNRLHKQVSRVSVQVRVRVRVGGGVMPFR